MLTYLPDVGLEVAHEIHSFFEDGHNQQVIGALLSPDECGLQLQEQGELSAEFAASTTLGGLLDKLHVPSVGPGAAQKLADKFGSLEGVIKADWLDMRQALPRSKPRLYGSFSTMPTTPTMPWLSSNSSRTLACTGRARKARRRFT